MRTAPFTVLLLAGGKGTRMGTALPKQYLSIYQKPIALYSFEAFLSLPEVRQIAVVCEEQYEYLFQSAAKGKAASLLFARPGERRQDSVSNGIQLLKENELICIHDSARPLIMTEDIYKVVQIAESWDAAVLGVKARSTIKICDGSQLIVETPKRDNLWEIQTPQVIRLNLLKEGFQHVRKHQLTVTDDASLIELIGKPVKVVEGSYANIKVTTPEDLEFVEKLIEKHALLQNHNCL